MRAAGGQAVMETDRSETRRPLQDALDDAIAQLDRVRATRSSWIADALPSVTYYEAELHSLRASLERALSAGSHIASPMGTVEDAG